MGHYLNRTTKQLYPSMSPTEVLLQGGGVLGDYIENPDLSGVVGVSSIYWNIVGDVISEMSQPEQDAVNVTRLSDARDAEIQGEIDELESTIRQLTKLMVDEINILRQQFNTSTGEVPQLTTTTFLDRTLVQVRNQLRNDLGT